MTLLFQETPLDLRMRSSRFLPRHGRRQHGARAEELEERCCQRKRGRGRAAAVGCGAAVLGVRGAPEGTNAAAAALYLGLLSRTNRGTRVRTARVCGWDKDK
jgi:hypothetical protein